MRKWHCLWNHPTAKIVSRHNGQWSRRLTRQTKMDRYMNELIDSKAWNFEDKGSGKRLPSWATKIRLNFLMDNEANDWPDKPNWIYIYMNEKNLIAKPETLKTKAAEKDILLGQHNQNPPQFSWQLRNATKERCWVWLALINILTRKHKLGIFQRCTGPAHQATPVKWPPWPPEDKPRLGWY